MKKKEKENLEGEFTVTSEGLKQVKFEIRKFKIQNIKTNTVFKLLKTDKNEDWDEDNFKYVRKIASTANDDSYASGKVVKIITTLGNKYIGDSNLDYDYFANIWIGQVCEFPSIEENSINFNNLNKIVTSLNDDFPTNENTFSLTNVFVRREQTELWKIEILEITSKNVLAVVSSKSKGTYILPPSKVLYTIKTFKEIIKNYEKYS